MFWLIYHKVITYIVINKGFNENPNVSIFGEFIVSLKHESHPSVERHLSSVRDHENDLFDLRYNAVHEVFNNKKKKMGAQIDQSGLAIL